MDQTVQLQPLQVIRKSVLQLFLASTNNVLTFIKDYCFYWKVVVSDGHVASKPANSFVHAYMALEKNQNKTILCGMCLSDFKVALP